MELFSLFRCKIKLNYFKVVKMGHFDRKIAKIRPKVMEIKVLRQVVFLAPSVFALTVPPVKFKKIEKPYVEFFFNFCVNYRTFFTDFLLSNGHTIDF